MPRTGKPVGDLARKNLDVFPSYRGKELFFFPLFKKKKKDGMKVLDPSEQLIHFRKLSWNHQKVDTHLESKLFCWWIEGSKSFIFINIKKHHWLYISVFIMLWNNLFLQRLSVTDLCVKDFIIHIFIHTEVC